MRYITGDIWTTPADVKVIPTNGVTRTLGSGTPHPTHVAVMGAGLALDAKKRLLHLPVSLGNRIHRYGNILHVFHIVPGYRGAVMCNTLVMFPTKDHYSNISDVELIRNRARDLALAANQHDWREILLPKLGCGLGRLEWDFVESILSPYFDDRFIVIEKKNANEAG